MSMITKVWQWFESRQPTEHERAQDLLSDYLDGRLSPQATTWLEEHLQVCNSTCPRDLEALRHTVQMVRQLPAVPPPRSFALSQSMLTPRRVPPPGWIQLYLPRATAVAALLLIVLISGDLGLQFFYTIGQAPVPAAPAEIALEQAAPEGTPAPSDREVPPDEAFGGEVEATPTPQAESRAVETAPPSYPFSAEVRALESLALVLFLILGLATAFTIWRNQI